MKKTKLIALTMVVALMVVGAGYAAWSDTVELNQNVNTGHLNIHFVDITDTNEVVVPANMSGYVEYGNDGKGNYNDGDVANVYINNAYPGSVSNVTLKMSNSSTMAVKLQNLGLKSSTMPTSWISSYEVKVDGVKTNYPFNATADPGDEIVVKLTISVPNTVDSADVKPDHNYQFIVHPEITQAVPVQ